MRLVARKKIVFVIVEGPSDEEALDAVMSKLFDTEKVYVHIMHGDVTTMNLSRNSNVISKIGDDIRSYAKSYHFTKKDFKEIIHIVDMDGAFIPDKNIIEDRKLESVIYSETQIKTKYKENIEKRNTQKRNNLNKLYSRKEIWDVPYRVFYMSCNLDHVLYNKMNSSDEDKKNDSYMFAKKYKLIPNEFLKFISESDFSVTSGYKESWEYIKQDLHSLERHTNLGICFDDNQ